MEIVLALVLVPLAALWAIVRRRRPETYELVRSLGLGDLSEVHEAVRGRDRFVLKIPRVADLNSLAVKERYVLVELGKRAGDGPYRRYLPEPVEAFPLEGRQVNVFRWRDGFRTAEEIRGRFPRGLDGRHVAWMFNRTLEVLGFVHRAGWIHGAVLPPHLLFHPEDHGLLLVGWIHAERPNGTLRLVPGRYADWYPREVQDREPVTPSADIYLAARSMLWLADRDLPAGVRRFLRGCLLESASRRCQDAWKVREEFSALLEGVYGPPRFHPLLMG